MRSPDGKSECGDDGRKGVRSSGNAEETEDGNCVQETKWRGDRARKMVEGGIESMHA